MKPSVIVIDDDHDIVEVLSEFLRLRSINVLAVGYNGKEAVELYQKYRPDVVLMDFMMPDFNGLYGLENIHKLDSNARIILLSGSIGYDIHKKLKYSGFSSILQKPNDLDNIVDMINKISLEGSIQEPLHNVWGS